MRSLPHNPAHAFPDADMSEEPPRLRGRTAGRPEVDPVTAAWRGGFEAETFAAYQGAVIPERRWLAGELLPLNNVTMISGDGGLGKSLLSQQLGTAVALGADWLGMRTAKRRVLAVYCEDDGDELLIRQSAINRAYGCDFRDLGDFMWSSRVGHDNTLVAFPNGVLTETPFLREIEEWALDFGAGLVILDSLHDLFGGNENYRNEVRSFVGRLRRLAIRIDGVVLLNAHPSLSGRNTGTGESGSTAWNNSVRNRLYLKRAPDDDGEMSDERVLQTMKSNYGPAGGRMRLQWTDGVFARLDTPNGVFAGMAERNAEAVFLECLAALTRQGRVVNDSKSGNFAPRVMARLPEARGFRQRDLEGAMQRLFSAGRIRLAQCGRPSRPQAQIVVTDEPSEGQK